MALPADALTLAAPVNWRDGYTVAYAYLTQIITVDNGDEQRIARRRMPRRTVNFTATLPFAKARVFEAQVAANQGKRFILPEMTAAVPAPAGLAAGVNVLPLPSIPVWAIRGAIVVLVNGTVAEARTIAAVGGNMISFNETTQTVFPMVSTVLAPGMLGRLQASFTGSRKSSQVTEIPVQLAEDPGTVDFVPFWDSSLQPAGPLYHGREFFSLRPNWNVAPSVQYDTDISLSDYDQGVITYDNPNNLRSRTTQFSYTQMGRDVVKSVTDFFRRMKGQQRSFYMPTWTQDLELEQPFVPNATVVAFKGTFLNDFYATDRVYRNIVFVTAKGLYPASITQTGTGGTFSLAAFAQPLPTDLKPADVIMICWLPMVRLSTDTLSIGWQSDNVAVFNWNVKTVPDVFDEITLNSLRLTISGLYVTMNFRNPVYYPSNYLSVSNKVVLEGNNYLTIGDL